MYGSGVAGAFNRGGGGGCQAGDIVIFWGLILILGVELDQVAPSGILLNKASIT